MKYINMEFRKASREKLTKCGTYQAKKSHSLWGGGRSEEELILISMMEDSIK
jgi:hypothetical protein